MSNMRFFSLEPLDLDLSTRDRALPPKSLNLSQRMLELIQLDVSNDLSTHAHQSSSILQEIAASQCVQQTHFPEQHSQYRRRSRSIIAASVATSSFTWIVSRFCNIKIPVWADARLKDISATIQQFDVRNEQARVLPKQYKSISQSRQLDLPYAAAQYISFYNIIWLVLNDIIIGFTVGLFLRENNAVLGRALSDLTFRVTVTFARDSLIWLDDWPAGLKLNTELSRFFCLSFLGAIDLWNVVLLVIAPYFSTILLVIGYAGPLGVTMVLSLVSDLLSVLSAPLYVAYLIATSIFSLQLEMAGSLFRLSRGKRKNVLQNRTDAWDYDLDQLLLGTILFTLLAFLFPTILVYYMLFALIRLAIILIHAVLETCLAFMNHFPLFAVMVRLKDPARLPGGVYLLYQGNPPELVIKNSPIPLSRIFFQHFRVWSKLSAHYSPLRLLRCLLTGSFISPISRYSIRYDALSHATDR